MYYISHTSVISIYISNILKILFIAQQRLMFNILIQIETVQPIPCLWLKQTEACTLEELH